MIGKKVINVNNKSKLESITDYYLRFVVELLFKCCGCSITQLFIEDQKKKKITEKKKLTKCRWTIVHSFLVIFFFSSFLILSSLIYTHTSC